MVITQIKPYAASAAKCQRVPLWWRSVRVVNLPHRFAVKAACRYSLTAERAIEAFPAGVSAEKTIEYRFLKRCRPKREHTEPRVSAASRRSDATCDGDWTADATRDGAWARPRSELANGRWWGFPYGRSFASL